ncbi:hypothetical protein ACH5RR_026613 [Cinchona calisaya]|uniref:Uncharacterized protein n=1 Tax=Cinchona calisaya TaxID=153742 RepID=A0ABD2Z4Y9_9GENT
MGKLMLRKKIFCDIPNPGNTWAEVTSVWIPKKGVEDPIKDAIGLKENDAIFKNAQEETVENMITEIVVDIPVEINPKQDLLEKNTFEILNGMEEDKPDI